MQDPVDPPVPGAEARCAAAVAAACASWTVDGALPGVLLEVAAEEAAVAVAAAGADPALVEGIHAVAAGQWRPPAAGIDLHPYTTLLAVLHCIHTATSLAEAVERAITLGGDTDTVAALTAGLLGALSTPDQVRRQLPWSSQVQLPAETQIGEIATRLATRRTGRVDG